MNLNDISENIAKGVVACIEDAVGDSIRADIISNRLSTTNSVPSRIWDFINRNMKEFGFDDCVVSDTNRGPWQMTVVYDNKTQCVFTIMREKRFNQLKKAQKKRNKMHYVDMLAKQFNSNLTCAYQQTSFFTEHHFDDEERLSKLVQQLLSDLVDDIDLVNNHILVLFETIEHELISVRAVMITPSLDVADNAELSWSQYISNNSAIVEKVSSVDSINNSPNKGLKLSAKATQRKKTNSRIKDSDIETLKNQ
ncbi:MAG: hypothetical protein IJJ61_05555 [Clostridia bacterium]|nr:hypothetical protein [Clostridia bacterium]MBQ6467392.1 hypothetical protein [Clostridia bacterium]